MVFQFLGFPSLNKYIAIIAGLAIIFIAYRLQPEPVREKKLNFVEHKNDETINIVEVAQKAKEEVVVMNTDAVSPEIINSQEDKTS